MDSHTVNITDDEPELAAYCMWLMLLQQSNEFVYSTPCWDKTQSHLTVISQLLDREAGLARCSRCLNAECICGDSAFESYMGGAQ